MQHKRSFYVVNDDASISTNDDCDGLKFNTQAEAEAHAKALADGYPGHVYEVVSTVSGFVTPIGVSEAVEVTD